MKTNKELEADFKKLQGSLEKDFEIHPNGYVDPSGKFHTWPGYSNFTSSHHDDGQKTYATVLEGAANYFGIKTKSDKAKEAVYNKSANIKSRNKVKTDKFANYVDKEIRERNDAKQRFTPTENYKLYER